MARKEGWQNPIISLSLCGLPPCYASLARPGCRETTLSGRLLGPHTALCSGEATPREWWRWWERGWGWGSGKAGAWWGERCEAVKGEWGGGGGGAGGGGEGF